jgi:hypothetical protein
MLTRQSFQPMMASGVGRAEAGGHLMPHMAGISLRLCKLIFTADLLLCERAYKTPRVQSLTLVAAALWLEQGHWRICVISPCQRHA